MRGVWFEKKRKKWRVTFANKFIGRYKSLKEAVNVRVKLERQATKATKFQIQCYQLCSPDFMGLTQRQAGMILRTASSNVCKALRRLRNKYDELFPIYIPRPAVLRFEDWMSDKVVVKI